MILLYNNAKLMEGPVVNIVYQNSHISCRDFPHPLALFLTLLLFLFSPSIAPKSPWKNSRLIVFLSREGGQSDSSPPQMEEMPIVPDLPSSTNSFAIPTQPLPVHLLPDERHRLPLFASTIPSLPLSASLLSPFVVSSPLLAFSLSSPISFSLLLLPLFLLSALTIVVPLPPRALSLPPLFILQAPVCTFHYWSLTSKQS